ncbi:7,8-didemethyl-8-hydroxy-5-deazariboflavin synthase subunit CofG [Phormidium sp. LEGE 05292]|uniref:7,8-didemethyl-8-hydroxy-5-deazariboflavin synthase subunit CofG n=1 Tax=[Phormidium] sp. LEGE 05292 TaxID=767427 RepID=UPI0018808169|nr:7,8-didemethyl-8-hydroxy-5-deazariboflavin synthase subunit CofG [Phormidium sp. LEGE 05292]MBE9228967.1 7,8-didemethyl-8-hydroxy-5-deazariboflavin synthase subunit CofG [Phormidium sp. LEGE 05292]
MSASTPRKITYSPAYTIVPTYECFNRCTYCNFRTDPGKSPWLTLTDAEILLKSLQNTGVCEILILSGEVHPSSPLRKAWFDRIYNLCQLALSLGFLPHTNVGPLTFPEMAQLKTVNVSMGLMLEQLTPNLLKTVHKNAPSKLPELRLQQLEFAGELKIPFTTGLLLGIGENSADWWESLEAIAKIHQRWGNIQEVILQPHSPGTQQSWQFPAFDIHLLPEIITKAKEILPTEITIQIPPNLVQTPELLLACLEAGARDLGGIGPKDEVNPDYPHPHYQKLTQILQPAGWELVPRLPIYPQYDDWLSEELQNSVKQWQNTIKVASSIIM